MARQLVDIPRLVFRDVAQVAGGCAGPELALGDALARRYDRACCDPATRLHHGAVHHARFHADEARILKDAGVDEAHMADRHIGADARAFLELARDMDDGAVLDVGIGADANRRDVAAEHAAEPDIGIGRDLGIADDHRRRCHPRGIVDARQAIAERDDERRAHEASGSSSPAVSGNPSIRFMFCTAAPDAPLPRLSKRATSRTWAPSSDAKT